MVIEQKEENMEEEWKLYLDIETEKANKLGFRPLLRNIWY